MIQRIYRAVSDPTTFWREVFKYGYQQRHQHPKDWFLFRHEVSKQCAVRRQPNDALPRRRIEQVFPGITDVAGSVQYRGTTAYSLSWLELIVLSSITRLLSPKAMFEFGTFDGRTTLHLAINAPEASVHTLDVEKGLYSFGSDDDFFDSTEIGEHVMGSAVGDRVTLLYGDSTQFDTSPYEDEFDLIFIDGGHAYDIVRSDSEKAFRMGKSGATLVWHDYLVIDDVTRALLDIGKERELVSLEGTSLVVHKLGPQES